MANYKIKKYYYILIVKQLDKGKRVIYGGNAFWE